LFLGTQAPECLQSVYPSATQSRKLMSRIKTPETRAAVGKWNTGRLAVGVPACTTTRATVYQIAGLVSIKGTEIEPLLGGKGR
jgi:hypothetical protein